MAKVDTIRNLGPRSVEVYAKAGIESAEELRAMGPDAAYARLLGSGSRPHFIAYYALVMGLQGRPWNDLGPDEKAALRHRFDAIVAGAGPTNHALEAELDRIGAGPAAEIAARKQA